MTWICSGIGCVAGFLVALIIKIILPRLEIRKINQKVVEEESALQEKNRLLQDTNRQLDAKISKQQSDLLEMGRKIEENTHDILAAAQLKAEEYYQTQINSVNEKLDLALEKKSIEYQQAENDYRKDYEELLRELTQEYTNLARNLQNKNETLLQETNAAAARLKELQATVDAAVEANIRAEKMRTSSGFYQVQIPESDLWEIKKLREVEPYLRDKEALNKVIWKVYYEKPTSDLIGRVLGAGCRTGIYKITELATGKCYVGQARDVAVRWKQHIKRGVGAEAPTRNKLYPAMREAGVENFSFELVEECAAAKLDEREDYWQDYFQAKVYGFSIK